MPFKQLTSAIALATCFATATITAQDAQLPEWVPLTASGDYALCKWGMAVSGVCVGNSTNSCTETALSEIECSCGANDDQCKADAVYRTADYQDNEYVTEDSASSSSLQCETEGFSIVGMCLGSCQIPNDDSQSYSAVVVCANTAGNIEIPSEVGYNTYRAMYHGEQLSCGGAFTQFIAPYTSTFNAYVQGDSRVECVSNILA